MEGYRFPPGDFFDQRLGPGGIEGVGHLSGVTGQDGITGCFKTGQIVKFGILKNILSLVDIIHVIQDRAIQSQYPYLIRSGYLIGNNLFLQHSVK